MNKNNKFIISYNSTCFNNRASGANQRFFTIYLTLIKNLKNITFNIYQPIDADFKRFFRKIKNVNIIQTTIRSQTSYIEKIINIFKLLILFTKDKSNILEVFNLPFLNYNKKNISITIHDLRYFNFDTLNLLSFFYRIALRVFLLRIPNIITVSKTMKKELKKIFPKKNIQVIYNAIDASFSNTKVSFEKKKFIQKKYGIYNKFIFSIGHLEERKNYINLISGFNIFLKTNPDCQLIICGFGDTYERTKIIKFINILNLNSHVLLLENITETEKLFFFQNAEFFIFPSLYEGFGIPLLEAMATNCPVIASNIGVFREIMGKDGSFFNPRSARSISLKMKNTYDNYQKRKNLIYVGKKRINYFKVEKIAKDLENYYKSQHFTQVN